MHAVHYPGWLMHERPARAHSPKKAKCDVDGTDFTYMKT